MCALLENKRSFMNNRKEWYEILEEHMKAPIEVNWCQTCYVCLGRHIGRLGRCQPTYLLPS